MLWERGDDDDGSANGCDEVEDEERSREAGAAAGLFFDREGGRDASEPRVDMMKRAELCHEMEEKGRKEELGG